MLLCIIMQGSDKCKWQHQKPKTKTKMKPEIQELISYNFHNNNSNSLYRICCNMRNTTRMTYEEGSP